MVRKNIYFVLILIISLLLFSSCSLFFDESKLNSGNGGEQSSISINYSQDSQSVIINQIPNAAIYKIEVDGVFEQNNLDILTDSVSYHYPHGDVPFDVHVYVYNERNKLIAEAKETFTPLVIGEFTIDKVTGILTFDKVLYAEGYTVRCKGVPDKNIFEERLDLNEYLIDYINTVKITPYSSMKGTIGVEKTTVVSKYENINTFYYDGIKEMFYFKDGSLSVFASYLTINDEIIELYDQKTYDYVVTKPTVASLRIGSLKPSTLDSNTVSINITEDENKVTKMNYNKSNKRLSWDDLGDDYSYEVKVIADEKIYKYETKSSYLTLSDLSLNEFEVSIRGITDTRNKYFTRSSFKFKLYDSIYMINSYDYDTDKTYINISSTEEDIIGYNISISLNDLEVFSKTYKEGRSLSFNEYSFDEAGTYKGIVKPIYKESDVIGIEGSTNFDFTVIRSATPNYSSFNNGILTFSQSQKIHRIEDNNRYVLDNNKFICENTNDTKEDIKKTYVFNYAYEYNNFSRRILLPAKNPLELTFTLLASVDNLVASNNMLSWDYSGSKETFVVNYNDYSDQTNDKFYVPNIYNWARIYVSPLNNNDNLEVGSKAKYIDIVKLSTPVIKDVTSLDDKLTINIGKIENVNYYEITIDNEVYKSTEETCTVNYLAGSKLRIKGIGKDNIFDSDSSIEYTINVIEETGYPVNDNVTKTIEIFNLDEIKDKYSFERIIYRDGLEYCKDESVCEPIDISSYDYGRYKLVIDLKSKIENGEITLATRLVDYDFTVIKYEIVAEQFVFRVNYFPQDIENDEIYRHVNFEIGTGRYGYDSDYFERFKETISPNISGLYKDKTKIAFEFTNITSNYYADVWDVFFIDMEYRFVKTVKAASALGSLHYFWNNYTEDFHISISDNENDDLTYTILKNKEEFLNTKSKTIYLEIPYTRTTYDLIIKNQILDDYYYTEAKFEKYVKKGRTYDYPQTMCVLNPIEDFTYTINWDYSGGGRYDISFRYVDWYNRNPINEFYLYIDIYREYYDTTTNTYGEKILVSETKHRCYNYFTILDINSIHLSDKTRLTFEMSLWWQDYDESKPIYIEYIAN